MKSYIIHLIRHGASVGNIKGQYIGITDSPLSKEGAVVLHKLKKEGEYPKAQKYYSSPLSRCTETMQILYPGVQFETIDDFRETSFGQWEGKTSDELKAKYPQFSKWLSGENTVIEGGESGAEFMYRVCAAFEKFVLELMKSGTSEAVLVTHGGVIMTILSAYGLPKANFYDWMTGSGCGYSLRITPGLWMRSMVAEVYETLPIKNEEISSGDSTMDEAREAADLIWGQKDTKGK